jgi:hypothetical protein
MVSVCRFSVRPMRIALTSVGESETYELVAIDYSTWSGPRRCSAESAVTSPSVAARLLDRWERDRAAGDRAMSFDLDRKGGRRTGSHFAARSFSRKRSTYSRNRLRTTRDPNSGGADSGALRECWRRRRRSSIAWRSDPAASECLQARLTRGVQTDPTNRKDEPSLAHQQPRCPDRGVCRAL